jgi:hypothetical protein
MMRISVIGTYHGECGAVSALALLQILERIQPQVIFAEIPRSHIREWMDGSHGTVESAAVARYAETYSVDVIPVDLPEPDASFFRDYEEVSRAIERTSPAFRHLVDLNTDRMRRGGFSYLNSDESIQTWAEIYREELETIEYIGNSRLRDIYSHVRELMERRDLEMLRNIRAYCVSTTSTRGAFLVGAAHRKSLTEKTCAVDESTTAGITWDWSGWQRPDKLDIELVR